MKLYIPWQGDDKRNLITPCGSQNGQLLGQTSETIVHVHSKMGHTVSAVMYEFNFKKVYF